VSTEMWPIHVLTLAEWDALPEDSAHRVELVEGLLLVAPQPLTFHQRVAVRITTALDVQLPPDLTALAGVEVLVDAGSPPTRSRLPSATRTATALPTCFSRSRSSRPAAGAPTGS
jgi:hypothetical protein